jgi:hypothetical protein
MMLKQKLSASLTALSISLASTLSLKSKRRKKKKAKTRGLMHQEPNQFRTKISFYSTLLWFLQRLNSKPLATLSSLSSCVTSCSSASMKQLLTPKGSRWYMGEKNCSRALRSMECVIKSQSILVGKNETTASYQYNRSDYQWGLIRSENTVANLGAVIDF